MCLLKQIFHCLTIFELGETYGVAINRDSFVDDLIAIDQGQLQLAVHKDTFTKLGLSASNKLNKQLKSKYPSSLQATAPIRK